MKLRLFHRFLFVCLACLLAITTSIFAQDKDWRPVTPEELQLKTPKVEPDADAEALLWDVYVADEDTGGDLQTVLHHYLRIKIFNERGQESFSKMEIPFGRIEGEGFDINQIPDPCDPANLFRTSGRGVLLIYNIMDEVEYNAQGNRVKMIKRPDAAVEAQLVDPNKHL